MTNETAATRPKVSVIIAAYKAAETVSVAIESVLAQEGVSTEVLVCDDASQDNTPALVRSLAKATPAIKLVENPINTGPSGARNRGLEQAEGDWIAVLDSDDRFLAKRLQDMITAADAHGADIVIDDFIQVDEDGSTLTTGDLSDRRSAGWVSLEDWVRLNSFAPAELGFGYAKPLISRNVLERSNVRYNADLRNGEDYHFILELLLSGAKVYFTGQPGYSYTRRGGSISNRAHEDHMIALLKADEAIANRNLPLIDAKVRLGLKTRRRNLKRLVVTESVLGSIKQRRFVEAFVKLTKHPQAFPRILHQLGEALRKRI